MRYPKSRVEVWRFCTKLFGAACSTFLLQATIEYHLKLHGAEDLCRNFFVDDLFQFCNFISEMNAFQGRSTVYFSKADMPLSKWISSAREVNESFVKQGLTSKIPENASLLGVEIDLDIDCIKIKMPDFNVITPCKRSIISNSAGFYDPLGVLTQVQIQAKILIAILWVEGKGWDFIITGDDAVEWNRIVKLYVSNFLLGHPLCVITDPNKPMPQHVF